MFKKVFCIVSIVILVLVFHGCKNAANDSEKENLSLNNGKKKYTYFFDMKYVYKAVRGDKNNFSNALTNYYYDESYSNILNKNKDFLNRKLVGDNDIKKYSIDFISNAYHNQYEAKIDGLDLYGDDFSSYYASEYIYVERNLALKKARDLLLTIKNKDADIYFALFLSHMATDSLYYFSDIQNYLKEWKKYYSVQRLGRLAVVPEWIDYRPQAGEAVVKIDPGMAFGTGEHESTRICLTLLQECVRGGEEVLDVGCGSGILAAAAIKLGAAHADACDIDPVAVKAAEENAARNGAAEQVRVTAGSLQECARGEYDVILANITADVLIAMSGGFARHLKKGGALIMSGVINARAPQVEEAMKAAGFTCGKKLVSGEWTGYVWR